MSDLGACRCGKAADPADKTFGNGQVVTVCQRCGHAYYGGHGVSGHEELGGYRSKLMPKRRRMRGVTT